MKETLELHTTYEEEKRQIEMRTRIPSPCCCSALLRIVVVLIIRTRTPSVRTSRLSSGICIVDIELFDILARLVKKAYDMNFWSILTKYFLLKFVNIMTPRVCRTQLHQLHTIHTSYMFQLILLKQRWYYNAHALLWYRHTH